MSSLFYKLAASVIPCDVAEAAYYLGYKKNQLPQENIQKLIETCCNKMQPLLTPCAVYEEFDLLIKDEKIQFADLSFESKDLSRNLHDCKKIVVFAATIGASVDLLIRRSQLVGSADSAVMQGCGAMFIESFVDLLNEKIKSEALKQGLKAHTRFSPGYGDVPLKMQQEFFRLLPCNKIGLSLMETLIMAPEKSVTAFIGLE